MGNLIFDGNKSTMNDFELIQACVSGDKKSWDEFVDRFSRLIYDSIIRIFRKYGSDFDKDILDDLHNDVFVSLLDNNYKALRVFEGRNGCKVASYIRTISARKAIDFLRRIKPVVSIEEGSENKNGVDSRIIDALAVFSTEENIESNESAEVSKALLGELKKEEFKLCELFFIEKESPEHIAEKLGISVDNFYVRKQRVLNKLKKIAKDKDFC